MKTFPMFLKMQGRRVVIVGGGEQAAQKCRLILKTEAEIMVLADVLDAELAALHVENRILWSQTPIDPGCFDDTALVFVATGCRATDACIHALAKEAGAVVNVVDQPELCDAITPSIVDRSPVVVAIGTEGTAPVLARQIKTRMEELLEPRLGELAAVAGRLRDKASQRLGPRARRDLWRWVFSGPVRDTHAKGGERDAARMIKDAIETAAFGLETGGCVAFVGADCEAKDLMTLRGVQRLQEADVIFYDDQIDPEILDLARRDAERVFIGQRSECDPWPERKNCGVLISAARQGKRIVRLHSGDLSQNSTSFSEYRALRDVDLAIEIVPGVSRPSMRDSAVDRGTTLVPLAGAASP